MINREIVARRIEAWLRHQLTLEELVDWAETALMDGVFPEGDAVLAGVVARLGAADVRAFGLTWADCEQLLSQLGYTARVEISVA
jgi:hypothetical protein